MSYCVCSPGNSLPYDITCVAADRMLSFAAAGKVVSAFARNKEVVMRFEGHKQEVRLLLPLGDHLISVDSGGDFIVWDVQSGGEWKRAGPPLCSCAVIGSVLLTVPCR